MRVFSASSLLPRGNSARAVGVASIEDALDGRGSCHSYGMVQRARYLFVCVSRRPDGTPKGSCAARGSVELYERLKALLVARGLAALEVRACTASCVDTCWVGPTIVVEPDHYFYGRVQISDLEEIVDALVQGRRVERLVLQAHEFVTPRFLRQNAQK